MPTSTLLTHDPPYTTPLSRPHSAHSHQTELKFLITEPIAACITQDIRTSTQPDPHGAGHHADQYTVDTIYLDTPQYNVFIKAGIFGHAKYRIRRYNHSHTAFLERKIRRHNLTIKQRTPISTACLHDLTAPPSLLHTNTTWFHRKLSIRHLTPRCHISYTRLARILSANHARITLDTSITVTPLSHPQFITVPGLPVFPTYTLLELKYRGPRPLLFQRIIDEYALLPLSLSKYRHAIIVLTSPTQPSTYAAHLPIHHTQALAIIHGIAYRYHLHWTHESLTWYDTNGQRVDLPSNPLTKQAAFTALYTYLSRHPHLQSLNWIP